MLGAHVFTELALEKKTLSDSDLDGAFAIVSRLGRSGGRRDVDEGSVVLGSPLGVPLKARYFGNPMKFLSMWRSGGDPRRMAETRSIALVF